MADDRLVALSDRLPGDRTLQAVLLVTAVGLVARLYALGHRVAQWDEGRVAYWVLRYEETGAWEYRPIVHGPFLFHVDKWVFRLVGANDFTLRLVVALVGAAMPLAAWLFRHQLDRREIVALAGLLAFNPLLLYYSRFFRNDVLVAAFAMLSLGLFVRTVESSEPRYLYGAAACLALSFTAKENALLYPVCWIGAGVIVLDHRLYRAGARSLFPGRGEVRPDGGSSDETPDGDVGDDEASVDGCENDEETSVDDGGTGDTDAADDTDDTTGTTTAGETATAGGTATDATEGPGTRTADGPEDVPDADNGTLTVPETDPDADRSIDAATRSGAVTDRPPGAEGSDDGFDVAIGYLRNAVSTVRWWWPHAVLSGVLFFAIIVFFYAPRAGQPGALGLYNAVGNPGMWSDIVEVATIGSWNAFLDTWGPGTHRHSYMEFLRYFLRNIPATAAVTVTFAAVGFLADRYRGRGSRDLVALGTYWGVASLAGYPMVTDIRAPWTFVHVVAPLTIPAAVGLSVVYEWGRDAVRDRQTLRAAVAVVLAIAVVGWTAGVAYDVNYASSDDEHIDSFAHWTQPGNDLKNTLAKIEAISETHEGTDVLFYGTYNAVNKNQVLFYMESEDYADRPPARGGFGWYARLPLPWYMERYGANVTSTPPDGSPARKLADAPPVVIAYDWDSDEVGRVLEGYVAFEHRFKLWGENIVVFIDCSALRNASDGHDWNTACPGAV